MLLTPMSAAAQSNMGFSQGSMNSTTETEQTITETIAIEKYGAAVNTYSGHNVTPSGAIGATGTTYSMNTGAENWQLEITTRAAGIIETQDIERTIETTTGLLSSQVHRPLAQVR